MPSISWREKLKAKTSKEKANKKSFENWFAGKKKAQKSKGTPKADRKECVEDARGISDKGKGKGKSTGRGYNRFSEHKSKGNGKSFGLSRSSGTWDGSSTCRAFGGNLLGDGSAPPEGVSPGLLEKLLATKKRLLNGATSVDDGPADADAKDNTFLKGRDKHGSKTKRDFGKGDPQQKRERDEHAVRDAVQRQQQQQQQAAAKKFKPERLWLAPPSQVNREERVALNRKIAEYGQARDLANAHAVLADLEQRGWANGHTYAAAVNALCRCGDWVGAFNAMKRAEGASLFKSGAGAMSSVIARTAMLKGFFDGARDLGRARALLERMERSEVLEARPNTRTANTYLRGCLVLGAVKEAEGLLDRMEKVWCKDKAWRDQCGGAPDASSYETVVALLCQALRYIDASKLASRTLDRLGASPGSAGMFVAVARAAAVRGDVAAARAAADRAHELLAQEEKLGNDAGGHSVSGSGGKRGTMKMQQDDNEFTILGATSSRAKSLEVFQSHRRGELSAELKDITKCLRLKKGKKGAQVTNEATKSPDALRPQLHSLWSRTLAFDDFQQVPGSGKGGTEDPATSNGAARAIVRRLCERFGLEVGSEDANIVHCALEKAIHGATPAKSARQRNMMWKRRKHLASMAVDHGGNSVVPPLFAARLELAGLFHEISQPVHLEVCSGGGEWLCAQALHNRSASWVACELRYDRAARCFQRLALHGFAHAKGNVGLIVGDAREALQRRLLPGSVARLFVNHPEPPQQTNLTAGLLENTPMAAASSSSSATSPTHLLTPDFLLDGCGAVLRKGGTLTICTDNLDYGLWLLRTLASPQLVAIFEDALKGTNADRAGHIESSGDLSIRSAPPPAALCGAEYAGEAGASYFQRLKLQEKSSRGDLKEEERYFICLRRQ